MNRNDIASLLCLYLACMVIGAALGALVVRGVIL